MGYHPRNALITFTNLSQCIFYGLHANEGKPQSFLQEFKNYKSYYAINLSKNFSRIIGISVFYNRDSFLCLVLISDNNGKVYPFLSCIHTLIEENIICILAFCLIGKKYMSALAIFRFAHFLLLIHMHFWCYNVISRRALTALSPYF